MVTFFHDTTAWASGLYAFYYTLKSNKIVCSYKHPFQGPHTERANTHYCSRLAIVLGKKRYQNI